MKPEIRRFALVAACLLALSACSNGLDSVSPGSAGPVAAAVAATTATTARGIVGTSVVTLPTVIVRDAKGNPLADVGVSFFATRGGGSVTGGNTSTNSSGIARPAGWTLGKTPGENVLVAYVGTLPPVTFTLTTDPGPAAFVVKTGGDNQVGASRQAVSVRPKVRVIDEFGNALAGITTSFAVTGGGGTASGTTVITDSAGDAAPASWILGDAGNQTLIASVDSVPPVTFAAVAIDLDTQCLHSAGLAGHVTVRAELTGASCMTPDGRLFVTFPVILTSAESNAHQFILSSLDFDTEIELRDTKLNLIATNNDAKGAGTNSSMTVLVPQGVYLVVVTSHKAHASGAFDLAYRSLGSEITGCQEVFATRGIVSTQSTTPEDCQRGSYFADQFRILIGAGEQVSVDTEDMSYSGTGLELADSTGKVVATGAYNGGYTQTLTFTAPVAGFYVINAWIYDEYERFSIRIR